jgi:uncharacterized protein YqeY
MLIDELKKANIEALKAHDDNKRAVLSVVINKYKMLEVEARSTAKEIGDAELLSVIQKTLKELADEKQSFLDAGRDDKTESINAQEELLKGYLPKQLDEPKIREEINKLEDKSLPNIMKHFKVNFAGKVDMGLVSKIAREVNS